MKFLNPVVILLAVIIAASFHDRVWSDTFGSGANTFVIDFVTIGNPGNAADTTGSPNPTGAVPYVYRMGKYEISEQMIDKANALGGLNIGYYPFGPDKPAMEVTWNEAARFVNWLNISNGSTPAYKFAFQPGQVGYDANNNIEMWTPSDAGYNPNNLFRNSLARYFLPSANEWYKAAYYDPVSGSYFDYPTGSDAPPIAIAGGTTAGTAVYGQNFSTGPSNVTLAGGLSPFGTMSQGGNAAEWEETDTVSLVNDSNSIYRGVVGGDFWTSDPGPLSSSNSSGGGGVNPTINSLTIGFRVASLPVPEPTSLMLLIIGAGALSARRR